MYNSDFSIYNSILKSNDAWIVDFGPFYYVNGTSIRMLESLEFD